MLKSSWSDQEENYIKAFIGVVGAKKDIHSSPHLPRNHVSLNISVIH